MTDPAVLRPFLKNIPLTVRLTPGETQNIDMARSPLIAARVTWPPPSRTVLLTIVRVLVSPIISAQRKVITPPVRIAAVSSSLPQTSVAEARAAWIPTAKAKAHFPNAGISILDLSAEPLGGCYRTILGLAPRMGWALYPIKTEAMAKILAGSVRVPISGSGQSRHV